MQMKILKDTLSYFDQKTNCLSFIPQNSQKFKSSLAVFGHGYTADKSSILSWASKLADEGMPAIIFDWPGHYLGNYSEVASFEQFKAHAHELFLEAYLKLAAQVKGESHFADVSSFKLILGGHSLGAQLALHASELPEFANRDVVYLGVGIGMAPKHVVHLFDTPFYKATLDIRRQLVSAELSPENVFPWIKEAKENLSISQKRIHLITGQDDVVVGEDGTERFFEHLQKHGNHVTMERPLKLPHHQPDAASSHIKKFIKDHVWV